MTVRMARGRAFDPAGAATAATDAILHDTLHGPHRGVVVDSPPGAGKSTLVVRAARELAAAGRPLMIVAQTNAQVDDLVLRLAEKDPELPVGRLHSNERSPYDPALDALDSVVTSAKAADLAGLDVVVSTAAKWAHTKVAEPWGHAIVDEAYQMRGDALLAVAGLFERALFVGDPGQLDPFSQVAADQWAGLSYDPSASAVSTLLAHNPGLSLIHIDHGDRRLAFGVPSDGSGPDRVLDEAAESGWGLLELPARHTPRTDPEAVRAVALVVRRLLDRGGAVTSERSPDPAPLTADRIAVGTAHRDQAAAVRAALADLGAAGVTVDTANRLQGREFDVTVVLHPLSGRPDATAFHLETGRLCVLTSRHRHACVVVCRAGVDRLLDEHPSTEPVQLGVTVKFPDGWEANHAVLSHLAEHRVRWQP